MSLRSSVIILSMSLSTLACDNSNSRQQTIAVTELNKSLQNIAEQQARASNAPHYETHVYDVDSDGDQDIVAITMEKKAGGTNIAIIAYENDGHGRFTYLFSKPPSFLY